MKLTKRNYLGVGYHHVFKNSATGSTVYVPCTQQEYERLGEVGGAQYNPTKEGHTWLCSEGGTIKVDSSDGVLKENEYCDYKGKYFVVAKNEGGQVVGATIETTDVVNDDINVNKIPKI